MYFVILVSVTLLASPMDVDVLSPASTVLNCTATGEPTPQFTWNKVFPNGTTVEVSDSMSNINISTTLSGENITSTLTISTTSALDTANYSCTAENMFGSLHSSEAQVTVLGKISVKDKVLYSAPHRCIVCTRCFTLNSMGNFTIILCLHPPSF